MTEEERLTWPPRQALEVMPPNGWKDFAETIAGLAVASFLIGFFGSLAGAGLYFLISGFL